MGYYQAASFDGTTSISFSDANLPSGSANKSVAFWARWRTSPSGVSLAFMYGTNGTAGATLGIGVGGSNEWFATNEYSQVSGPTAVANVWAHVAVVVVGTTYTIYIDGASSWSGDLATDVVKSGSAYIGKQGSGYPFDGDIAELQVYSSALSAGDVADLYNSGAGKYGAATGQSGNLLAGFHLDGDATDFSSYDTDGTWSGTAAYVDGPIEDASPPSVPTNVAASGGTQTDKVAVSWDAASGAASYAVYRDGTALQSGITALTYDDTAAPAGVDYDYTVKAVNGNGESAASSAATGWRGFPAITELVASVNESDDYIDLDFSALAGSAVVYRNSANSHTGQTTVTTVAAGATTYRDTGSGSNAAVYYWLRYETADHTASAYSNTVVGSRAVDLTNLTEGNVASGVTIAGVAGSYPTTAASKAAQLADDVAAVTAAADKIATGTTILTVAGSYPTTATSKAAQLEDDVAAVTAQKKGILNTVVLLGVRGSSCVGYGPGDPYIGVP